jgi:hypothetical protein
MTEPSPAPAELPRRKRPRTVRASLNVNRDGETVEKAVEVSRTVEEAEDLQLVEHLARLYAKRLRGHVRLYEASPEAADKAEQALKVIEQRDGQLREEAEGCAAHNLTWTHLHALAAEDMGAALEVWGRVRIEADDERVTGRLAAAGLHDSDPMALARFYSVRDAFLDEWQPRGGIETAMIDMLAQTFALYLYWTQISHARAVGLCDNLEEIALHESWNKWKMPHEMTRDSIEEAHRMADRYNRMFLRTLRQMRDLRRYPSVIVNNGGQVNVAQSQVNAQRVG